MNSKLFFCLLHLICTFPAAFSASPTDTSAPPYLALIEVKQEIGGSYYFNGVFASMTWVLSVSHALAQEPTGRPRNGSFTVYGELSSFDQMASAPKRGVRKIVTDLMGSENNKYFPNLVLLQLDNAFQNSSTLKPATFNIGKLSTRSDIVGWAADFRVNAILPRPVSFPVKVFSSEQCSSYTLVEFIEQFCCTSSNFLKETFHFLDGALVVDNSQYITGMLQFTSLMRDLPEAMPLMVITRLSYFQTFWQFHVIGTQETFLNTDFKDDLMIEPWNKPEGDKGVAVESLNQSVSTGVIAASPVTLETENIAKSSKESGLKF